MADWGADRPRRPDRRPDQTAVAVTAPFSPPRRDTSCRPNARSTPTQLPLNCNGHPLRGLGSGSQGRDRQSGSCWTPADVRAGTPRQGTAIRRAGAFRRSPSCSAKPSPRCADSIWRTWRHRLAAVRDCQTGRYRGAHHHGLWVARAVEGPRQGTHTDSFPRGTMFPTYRPSPFASGARSAGRWFDGATGAIPPALRIRQRVSAAGLQSASMLRVNERMGNNPETVFATVAASFIAPINDFRSTRL